jgi:hypothetical protein
MVVNFGGGQEIVLLFNSGIREKARGFADQRPNRRAQRYHVAH